jgi:hypothetical protein
MSKLIISQNVLSGEKRSAFPLNYTSFTWPSVSGKIFYFFAIRISISVNASGADHWGL